jgi:hypothetical protein
MRGCINSDLMKELVHSQLHALPVSNRFSYHRALEVDLKAQINFWGG